MTNEANTDPQGETPNGTVPPGETPNAGTGETPGTTTTTPLSIEELQKLLDEERAARKKANSEAAAHRHDANEYKKLKSELEASKLSETEKLQKQLATLQAEKEQATLQAQELRVGSAIQLQALQQGIDPTLASKLIDRSEIEYGDDGTPANVADVLKALIKQYPTLVSKAQAATSGGATNPSRSQSTAPQELSWEAIIQLQKNPEEYNRRNADGSITRWLYQHPHRYGMK